MSPKRALVEWKPNNMARRCKKHRHYICPWNKQLHVWTLVPNWTFEHFEHDHALFDPWISRRSWESQETWTSTPASVLPGELLALIGVGSHVLLAPWHRDGPSRSARWCELSRWESWAPHFSQRFVWSRTWQKCPFGIPVMVDPHS